MKVCVSISGCSVEECVSLLAGQQMAEVRLETIAGLGDSGVGRIFSAHKGLIATCRAGKMGDDERKRVLLDAISAGAAYVDVEVDAPDPYKEEIVRAARARGCKVIVSFHDYQKTPVREELAQIVKWCFDSGADIAKVACKANSGRDSARLLGLIDSERPVVAVGMGKGGRVTRVAAPILGSPFTYASVSQGRETAEGQMGREEIERLMGEIGDA